MEQIRLKLEKNLESIYAIPESDYEQKYQIRKKIESKHLGSAEPLSIFEDEILNEVEFKS